MNDSHIPANSRAERPARAVNAKNMPDEKLAEKLPPQNLEAEQSFLGCLLIDKDALIKVVDLIDEDDFYKDGHRLLFGTIKELFSRHEPIDILSLTNRLEEKNELQNIGGRTYLAHLSNFTATASHVVHYANIIQRKATLRRLQAAASEITELSFKEDEDIEKTLDMAEQKLFSVSQKYMKNVFVPVDRLLADAFERIDELHKQSGKLRGLPTGFPDLDGSSPACKNPILLSLPPAPA